MFQVQEDTSSIKNKSTGFFPPTYKSRFLEHKRHALVASPAQSLKISTRALFSSTIKRRKQRFFRFPHNPSYPKKKRKTKTGEREGERYQFSSRVETGRASLRGLVHPKGEMK